MSNTREILFILMFFHINLSFAFKPEEGLWHDPERVNQGVNIEIQNGVLIVQILNESLNWELGVALEVEKNAFSELTYSGNFNATNQPFSIHFFDREKAVLQINDDYTNIEKLYFGYSELENKGLDFLEGIWLFHGYDTVMTNQVFSFSVFFDEYDQSQNDPILLGTELMGQQEHPFRASMVYDIYDMENKFMVSLNYMDGTSHRFSLEVSENSLDGTAWKLDEFGEIIETHDVIGVKLADKHTLSLESSDE